jgi:hypothetical protein
MSKSLPDIKKVEFSGTFIHVGREVKDERQDNGLVDCMVVPYGRLDCSLQFDDAYGWLYSLLYIRLNSSQAKDSGPDGCMV